MRRSLLGHILLVVATSFVEANGGAAGSGAGYDTSRLGPSNANCDRKIYYLNVTSDNVVFRVNDQIKPYLNQVCVLQIEDIVQELILISQTVITSLFQTFLPAPNNISRLFEGADTKQVTRTYALSGTLCTPTNGAKHASHVQYLVHGIGFDSR